MSGWVWKEGTGKWGCSSGDIEWGLAGGHLTVFPYCGRCRGGVWGDRGEPVTYQTPRHQVLGLNHNTANYLLLTRKNERGARMKKKKKKK